MACAYFPQVLLFFEITKQILIEKSSISWDITQCSPMKVNRPFGGTYRLHLEGRRISRARNQSESKVQFSARFHSGFLLGSSFEPEDKGDA
jgi:hypothetical protein